MVKRLRAREYYTLVKPLKEKYPDRNIDDLAKFGKCNIRVFYQLKKSQKPTIIAKSSTNFSDDLNYVTKTKLHPYSFGKYQLNLEEMKAGIYNSQSSKIRKMTLGEAFELNFKITKNEFIFRWGNSISIEKELEFRECFGRGFSIYVNHDSDYFTAEKIYGSMNPGVEFIVDPGDGEEYHLDLEVVVILEKNYLQPFYCEKTDGCPYKVDICRRT